MKNQENKGLISDHIFKYREVEKNKLIFSLSITSIVMFVELIAGLLTNSIALISDALHMFTHSFAIGISLIAIFFSKKPSLSSQDFWIISSRNTSCFYQWIFSPPFCIYHNL